MLLDSADEFKTRDSIWDNENNGRGECREWLHYEDQQGKEAWRHQNIAIHPWYVYVICS